MKVTRRQWAIGLSLVAITGIVVLLLIGPMLFSQRDVVPSPAPATPTLPAGTAAPSLLPSAAPSAPAGTSPSPVVSAPPGATRPVPTFVLATNPPGPGEPSPSIEIPPPIR